MLHAGLAGHIVFALPVELDEIALDQRELARLDLDQEDVAARRQDNEVDLPVPVLALMRGLPGDAMEDLVTARQRLLQTVQNIKLAVQAGIVPEGIQNRGYLRHRVCLLLRTTAWIIPQEGFLTALTAEVLVVLEFGLSTLGIADPPITEREQGRVRAKSQRARRQSM